MSTLFLSNLSKNYIGLLDDINVESDDLQMEEIEVWTMFRIRSFDLSSNELTDYDPYRCCCQKDQDK
ncbi:9326_t:CDS:2 [Funneliformis caledonium]|uniref:9326_t:CDS:1 n=1 Tax=Funneliformis caledonium TaxID=1117310 RepID=A0A9N8ZBW7_9GLOM|nr:9326_t:CDS:2 [Funneliformis caledonium]